MTAYNNKYRCEGGQKEPKKVIRYASTLLGECGRCGVHFKLYRNGKMVMHKRDGLAARR